MPEKGPRSPAEALLAAADPEMFEAPEEQPLTADAITHRPWVPTGDADPKKTVELDRESANPYTVPPPETAGGSIPSGYAQFRKYGPDES